MASNDKKKYKPKDNFYQYNQQYIRNLRQDILKGCNLDIWGIAFEINQIEFEYENVLKAFKKVEL